MILNLFKSLLILSLTGMALGCSKSGSSYDGTTAEVAEGSIAGAAHASDSGGSIVSLNRASKQKLPLITAIKRALTLIPKAEAATYCWTSALVEGQGCTGS